MIIKSFFRKKTTIIYMIFIGIVISLLTNSYYSYIENTKQIENNYSRSFIQILSPDKIEFNNEYIKNVERIIHVEKYNYIIDKNLKDDETVISELFEVDNPIGSMIEYEGDQSVVFKVKNYYSFKNEWSEIYISEEKFNSLLKNDEYDYMVKIKSWLMKEKVVNMLIEAYPNAEIYSYEINNSSINYVDFNNNYKTYSYFYLMVLIVLMIVVVISVIKNEKKDKDTYRLLGFNKTIIIKYTIEKITILLISSIIISIIISLIIRK